MGRKSRHSAKTGDVNLYKSRTSSSHHRDNNTDNNSDDDAMYNEVERHYNKHIDNNDYLRLDDDDDDDEEEQDDGVTTKKEGVFDLGMRDSDDEDDDSDNDTTSDDEEVAPTTTQKEQSQYFSDDTASSSSEEDEEAENTTDVFNWGSNKHSYYHGDTADLEIGQDEEDALLEEEAGREVQAARLEGMEEDDFMLEDDDDYAVVVGGSLRNEEDANKKNKRKREKNVLLSRKDKLKLMKSTHPELMPVVDHFRGELEEFVETTTVVGDALFRADGGNEAEAVGSTRAGLQYLLTKSMLQASKALNLSMYLLLKAEQASNSSKTPALESNDNSFFVDDEVNGIQGHPVMDRLNQLSRLTDKLKENVEDKTPGLENQMHSLVKAASLMKGENVDDDSSGESSAAGESNADAEIDGTDSNFDEMLAQQVSDAEASSDSDEEDEAATQRRILTEAKFALRNQDIDANKSQKRNRRAVPSSMDFGDDAEDVSERAIEAGRKLASTMNSISQKSSGKSKKTLDNIEDEDTEYEQLQRGLAMMDEEFGMGSDKDEVSDEAEEEGFGDEDEDDFYSQIKSKSKAKKAAKKAMYAVAPKYPRLDEEVEGERAISRTIMKNRGLVAHKPKINRNPRVKKREQYRKALIRRKGAVREIRTEESHVYGGESTGIKSGISRSRKLGGGR